MFPFHIDPIILFIISCIEVSIMYCVHLSLWPLHRYTIYTMLLTARFSQIGVAINEKLFNLANLNAIRPAYLQLLMYITHSYSSPLPKITLPHCLCSLPCPPSIMDDQSAGTARTPGPLFTKRTDVVPQDLAVKSPSREIRFCIFQSLWHMTGSSATALSRCLSNFKATWSL